MKKDVYDGMRYPSIDDLLEKIDSKYKLAYASAKMAKIIEEYTTDRRIKNREQDEDDFLGDTRCHKPVGQALEKILQDKVTIEFEE